MEIIRKTINKKATLILPAISMLIVGMTHTINLRLHERPTNTSVYEWSCARARELVNQKRNGVLRLLNINQAQWQQIKRNLRPAIERASGMGRNALINIAQIPEGMKQSIYNVLQHPYVQRNLGIARITDDGFKITAERRNGNSIDFMLSGANRIRSPAGASGNTIYLIPELIRRSGYTSAALEATLGHELAHIQHDHVVETVCMQNIYRRQPQRQRASLFDFRAALHEFQRAYETEADIAGTFNNWILLDGAITQFRNIRGRVASAQQDPSHPSVNQRIQYLTEIYQAIQNDTNGTPNRPRPIPQVTQERRQTVLPNIPRATPNVRNSAQNRNRQRANRNRNPRRQQQARRNPARNRNRQRINRNRTQNRNPRRRTQARRALTQNKNRQRINRNRTQNRNPRRRQQARRTTQNRNRQRTNRNRNPRRQTQVRKTTTQNRNRQRVNQNRNPRRRTKARRTPAQNRSRRLQQIRRKRLNNRYRRR